MVIVPLELTVFGGISAGSAVWPLFSNAANLGGSAGSTIIPVRDGMIHGMQWMLQTKGQLTSPVPAQSLCFVSVVINPVFNVFNLFQLGPTSRTILNLVGNAQSQDNTGAPPYYMSYIGAQDAHEATFQPDIGFEFQAQDNIAVVGAYNAVGVTVPSYIFTLTLFVEYYN